MQCSKFRCRICVTNPFYSRSPPCAWNKPAPAFPPPGGGLCRRSRPFIFKVTAEMSVIAQISVIQVTVVGCVSVEKSEMLPSKPPSGRGEGQRCLAPSAGGRARIEWVYDTNAATRFATLQKKAGICSKSNKFLLFSRYFRSPMWLPLYFLQNQLTVVFCSRHFLLHLKNLYVIMKTEM